MVKRTFLRCALILPILFLMLSCSSQPPAAPSEVLEPMNETAPPKVEVSPSTDPAYQRLLPLLQSLGYEGVGLQYESPQTLELLYRVFSDSRAANRQVKLVYTGMQMAYDSRYQSLTVGGASDPAAILAFIQKSVPAKSLAPAIKGK